MVRLGKKAPTAKLEPDIDKTVSRLRYSLPLLRATLTDIHMRNFILSMIVAQNVRDARAMVLPEGALLHMVEEKMVNQYRDTLGGINSENINQVEEKLRNLGIDGRGQMVGRTATTPGSSMSMAKHKSKMLRTKEIAA